MPPADAVPEPRPPAAATSQSSRKAVRAGILAALSSPPLPPPDAVAVAVPAQPPPPVTPPPPPRGFRSLLRGAAHRGLLAAKPLAAPFLHRFQMRVRTAVDGSDLAARAAGMEQALARLSGRLEAEDTASRREIADVKRLVEETGRRLEAARREVAGVGDAAAKAALRLGAAAAAAAADAASDAAVRQEAMQRRLDETQRRLDETQQRLDAVQRGVAAVPDLVQVRLPPRAPVRVGDEFLVRTPDGYLLLPAEDVRLLAAMYERGVLERGTRSVLSALLRPGGVFLDVGAHVGTMTLLGAHRVGEGGRVFAVEPLPRLAALLRRSMALNDLAERVSVEACAAGEAEAEGVLHIGEVMGESSLLPLSRIAETGTARVSIRRLDDVVPAGTRIDAVKIDAEGAELRVWRGMRRVLEESPGLAAVLEFGPSHLARAGIAAEAWLGELEASGFEAYAIDEDTGVCRRASAPALAGVVSTNVLLLRPGAASRHPDLVFA